MRILNHILTALNAKLKVTNWWGGSTQALDGLPLGTSDGSATGEICVKTKIVGGGITVTSEATAEATAAAPAYTEGQDAPLSQDRSGNLRVITNSSGYSSQITVTRPANTTAYSDGDIVGATAAAITFTNLGPASGFISLNDADLRIDLAAVPAGMTSFRLHLYNATPPSALADNASWDLPSGDRASYLGYVDLGSPIDVGSTLFVQTGGTGAKNIAMGVTASLFGYLVTNTGYTPTSAATLTIRLNSNRF